MHVVCKACREIFRIGYYILCYLVLPVMKNSNVAEVNHK